MLHLYKASAGSGKTFTLTRHYLQLMLGRETVITDQRDPDTGKLRDIHQWHLREKPDGSHRAILAITFTNKATNEMMTRIIRELAILAGREPGVIDESQYMDYFVDLFITSPEAIRTLASAMLDELLADYAFFNVSTIDAFFQNVLRTFAREIEMPDNFELNLDDARVISTGVGRIFSSLNQREPVDPIGKRERAWLRDWSRNFMQQKFTEGKSFNMFSRRSNLFSELVQRFSSMFDETFRMNSSEITTYLADINKLIAFETGLRKHQHQTLERLHQAIERLFSMPGNEYISKNIAGDISKWENKIYKYGKTTVKGIDDYESRYAAKNRGKASEEFDNQLVEVLNRAVEYCDLEKRNSELFNAIEIFGLLGSLIRHMEEYCKENNMILLSETNTMLRSIINDDDTPFVYERLGYYLEHFLIDEFQDTSRMQWLNLRPLLLESMANYKDSLIIGDEKQSIYRFRNADPTLLGSDIAVDMIDTFNERALNIEGVKIEQNSNWRSARNVILFNNTFFHYLAPRANASDSYVNVIQQIDPKRKRPIPDGYVKLILERPPEKKRKNAEDTADETTDNNNLKAADQFVIKHTIDTLDRLLTDGYRPSDIAILCRRNFEASLIIKHILKLASDPQWSHGPVAVVSTDAVCIGDSPAVKMVIGVLRLAVTPPESEKRFKQHDGSIFVKKEVNAAFALESLRYRYLSILNSGRTLIDPSTGEQRPITPSEALMAALEAVDDDFRNELTPEEISNLLAIEKDSLRVPEKPSLTSPKQSNKVDVTCATLNTIVDRIIDRVVPKERLADDTVFLSEFQDLVLEFCADGNSDIVSFLEWWDTNGKRKKISQSSDTDAIRVMTIHASKGLEFPCVILPYANWDFDNISKGFSWFKLDKTAFTEVAEELVPPMLSLKPLKGLAEIPIFEKRINELKDEQRIDALNTAYVAFTRAKNDLTIIAPKSSSSSETLDKHLREVVDATSTETIATDENLDDTQRQWVMPLADGLKEEDAGVEGLPDYKVYEFGTPTKPEQKATETEEQKRRREEAEATAIPTVNNVVLPPYNPHVNEHVVTMNLDGDDGLLDYNIPRHRGILLHNIMSHVDSPADLSLALKRAAHRYHLTPEQTEECRAILTHALADERVKPWFEGYRRVINERTVARHGNRDRRPDRMVWTADGHIDIVDYKFGAMHPSYTDQLSDYRERLIRAGHPAAEVRAFLWFPETATITPV